MSHSESTTYRELYERMKAERDNWKWEYENVCKFATDYEQQRDVIRAQLAVAVEALELIAAPMRADGTYNRNREACEELASAALRKLRPKADGVREEDC